MKWILCAGEDGRIKKAFYLKSHSLLQAFEMQRNVLGEIITMTKACFSGEDLVLVCGTDGEKRKI